jgi:hypothetical protein
VREAGQRALAAATADLDALAGWSQESFAASNATSGLERIIMDESTRHSMPMDAATGR